MFSILSKFAPIIPLIILSGYLIPSIVKPDRLKETKQSKFIIKSNNKKISAEINKNKKQSIWDLDES